MPTHRPFRPDGRFLAGGGESVTLWEYGVQAALRKGFSTTICGGPALAFSPDSKTLCRDVLYAVAILFSGT